MTTSAAVIGDSAYPPKSYPTEFQGRPIVGWMVYIGGNTPHVWTEAEIANLKAQPWCQFVVPCFVRSNPQGPAQAATDAAEAVSWAHAHGQPSGTAIVWDYETAVDSAYEQAVDQQLQLRAGLHEILYGSKATVTQNTRPSGGYDEASWTGAYYDPADTANQFGSWAAYDLGAFKTDQLWRVRTDPAAVPAPTVPEDEDDMAQAQNGYVTLSWSEGSRHIVQVAWDGSANVQPELRVVLLLESGPLVLAGDSNNPAWKPDHTATGKVLRFPADKVATAYGLELQPVGTPARYAASVS